MVGGISRLAAAVPDKECIISEWDGWGTSLAWFANAIGHHEHLTERVCQLLFDPCSGLGLNIVRYNIGAANVNDHLEQYRAGACVPCHRQAAGAPLDPAADAAQTKVLLESRRLGANIFEAFANSPPFYLTKSGNSRGHSKPLCNNLPLKNAAAFAAHLVDVVQYFKGSHGLEFQSISPFNEPFSPAWNMQMSSQEGCFMTTRCMAAVLSALHQELTRRALSPRPLVVSPEEFCVADTLLRHLLLPTPTQRLWRQGWCQRLHTHTYNSTLFLQRPPPLWPQMQDNPLWRTLIRRAVQRQRQQLQHSSSSQQDTAAALPHGNGQQQDHHHRHHPQQQQQLPQGVKLWVSEFGSGTGPAALAQHILKDLLTLHPSAWVYWQAVEDTGSSWGLLQGPLTQAAAACSGKGAGAAAAACSGEWAGAAAGAPPSQQAAAAAAAGAAGAACSGSGAGAAAAAAGDKMAGAAAAAASAEGPAADKLWAEQVVLAADFHVLALYTAAIRPGALLFALPAVKHRSMLWCGLTGGVDRPALGLEKGLQGVGAWHKQRQEVTYVVCNSSRKEQVVRVEVERGVLEQGVGEVAGSKGVRQLQVVVRVLDVELQGRGGSSCRAVGLGAAGQVSAAPAAAEGPAAAAAGASLSRHPSSGVWKVGRYQLGAAAGCAAGAAGVCDGPWVVEMTLPPRALASIAVRLCDAGAEVQ